jgi:hypothetical protein
VATQSEFCYWVTFINDYSCWCTIVLLRKKSDTLAAFKTYKAFVEKQTGKQFTCLHDNKGGKFIGNEWDVYMQAEGIKREHTVRATSQQNGVAERKNRTMAECITAMLNEAQLHASFWGEARLLLCCSISLPLAPYLSERLCVNSGMIASRCNPTYVPLDAVPMPILAVMSERALSPRRFLACSWVILRTSKAGSFGINAISAL